MITHSFSNFAEKNLVWNYHIFSVLVIHVDFKTKNNSVIGHTLEIRFFKKGDSKTISIRAETRLPIIL